MGVYDIRFAIADLNSNKTLEAQATLSGITADVDTCNETFKEVGGTNIFAKEIKEGALYAELPVDVSSLIN
ncbi:hypothetical protein AXF42_Ash009579 [Apostasia shenzhenica]|uniref:Pectinesterase inhibitor domain-containing protein n=1 Tax=Apostasia shenzhenica TaxID=1088818 RepID=A0A2I0B990_9ASPA|nr:hypothetical protein AXF42_Ash009579 [Apostasia shenzhenica]